MRILMISDHSDPLADIGSKEAGGQNIYVYYLARFLARSGVFVDIYTRWDRKTKKEIRTINHHVRVIRVKAGPKRYLPKEQFLTVLDEFTNNIMRRMERENIQYDLIHTNYWYSGLAGLAIAKKYGLPHYHVYHSLGQIRRDTLQNYNKLGNGLVLYEERNASEEKIAKEATGIIATSPVEKDTIIKLFNVNPGKISVIPIGVDQKIFYPRNYYRVRRRLRISEDEKVLLYVGRIEWRKGINTLLFAFQSVLKQYPRSRLVIIGGGKTDSVKRLEIEDINRQQQLISELGLGNHVAHLGPKPQKELPYYYSAADVCVVPSYYEPFGIVPLESMACGTPVVASRTGGLQYTVQDRITGRLAEVRNQADLAEKLTDVLENGKLYYSNKCVERVDKLFNWEKISKQYIYHFNRHIDRKENHADSNAGPVRRTGTA
ncbi:MAG: D-inositol 3-phosphate glycosyltransferase [bacterium ADurb.Bin400]|nr:MAG: D-inositol 3-phosphate glycosyltransferase [bacterium ADurb.Bin400]